MKKLLNFKTIRAKILVAFSAVILAVFLYSSYNVISIDNISRNTEEIIEKQLELLIVDEEIANNMLNRTGLVRAYMLYDDPKYRKLFEDQIDESIELENRLLELSDSEETKKLIEKKIQWGTLTDEVYAAYDRGDVDEALNIMANQVAPLELEIIEGFNASAKHREDMIKELGEKVINDSQSTVTASFYFGIAAIVLSIIFAIITATMMSNRIKRVKDRLQTIAAGDLSQEPLKTDERDEIAQLLLATNEMSDSIRGLLFQISYVSETVSSQSEELSQSANEVRTGTEQIATTMEELASGTETQANSAGDLSSMMSSFTVQIQGANESGTEVEKNSQEVMRLTDEGSSLMQSSSEQMEKINHIVKDAVGKVEGLDSSAQKITNLVSVISDVANQTNLLALNAAIEAARAGEHGKGFAVVADEVRKLAEQVSLSVNDITDIVTSIQTESTSVTESLQEGYKEVQVGTEKIGSTEKTFTRISDALSNMVSSITTVSSNLSSIASGSEEMNGSIQEIAAISEESAAGVEQTSASAQQVNGSMEEIAGSSEELARLAEELNALVTKFKL
ncbi:methyl-accepting chemotaxis protein [Ornithinibacillus scapharcae]|uniref:methyl-accepting chemotaxis protein n=1 Tax=Ornithinibacillus scapharcae TaxID=1147159 RepID=UPI000225B421|nr:methyl-accepting chemotaxis protein [Ornithinibacillus scapharcae]